MKDVVASGAEIANADGATTVVQARREVVLSAGSVKSPVLLERSGTSDLASNILTFSSFLSRHNIPMKVLLLGVGERLQDQIHNLITVNAFKGSYTGKPGYFAYVSASNVFGIMISFAVSSVLSALSQYAAAVSAAVSLPLMRLVSSPLSGPSKTSSSSQACPWPSSL